MPSTTHYVTEEYESEQKHIYTEVSAYANLNTFCWEIERVRVEEVHLPQNHSVDITL